MFTQKLNGEVKTNDKCNNTGKYGEYMQPKISVIIPAYNVEKFIKKCVNSILEQSFSDFEIILVDDGSKDITPKICDELANKDSRITVIHKENGGQSEARNLAMRKSKGKYFAFVDGDDIVDKDYLQELYNLITMEENIEVAFVRGVAFGENTTPKGSGATVSKVTTTEEIVRKMSLRDGYGHAPWGKLFLADLWKDIEYPVGQIYEDYSTIYRVLGKTTKVAYSDAKMYFYIQHNESTMHMRCSEKTLFALDVADTETEFMLKTWPNIRDEILDLYVSVYLKNLQQILNTGMDAFPEYQERTMKVVKKNASLLLKSKRIGKNDKVKIIALLISKKLFLKLYNKFDGNVAVSD